MPRYNVRYEIANQDADTPDFLPQHVPEFQNQPKKRLPFWRGIFQTCLLILLYFVLSTGLTFYQQSLLQKLGYPLGIAVCHLSIKFLLSTLVRCVLECYTKQRRVRLSCQTMISTVAPPGIASGLDIGLSNWALQLLTVSLYTMTKSTSIIFILGFALLFRLERKSWSVMGTVVMIFVGLTMFTYKATAMNYRGFFLTLLASFSSGLRWTMAQLIMQKSKLGLGNPVDMMYHMQPWMLLAILPLALWFEGIKTYNSVLDTDWSDVNAVLIPVIAILGGAVIAFFMELAEFMVVTHTSSLTLSISSIVKEICTLVLAVEMNGDQMSGLNFVGLLVCLGGIIMHAIHKMVVANKDKIEDLELSSNSVINNGIKADEGLNVTSPLLTTKSTSLTNLLNENFSSDEDEGKNEENSSQVLFNILQRREQ